MNDSLFIWVQVKDYEYNTFTGQLRDFEFIKLHGDGSDQNTADFEIPADAWDTIPGGEQAAREMYERLLDLNPNVVSYGWAD